MEFEHFEKEIAALKMDKKVHEAQNRLFEEFITMAKSPKDEHVLKKTMEQALTTATQFSNAEKGSLFLLDENGVVTDSILTRDQLTGKKRDSVIGKVLEQGLAGWVKNHLTIGNISDTKTDPRWVSLPDQSYIARSVIAVPILRNKKLFGIITLMHQLPSQFDQTAVRIIQHAANQMAIIIENAKLYKKLDESNIFLENAKNVVEKYSKALDDELLKGKKIQQDFLPHHLPDIKNCDISARFHAALQLSGDFYDVFEIPGNKIGFIIADVCDKGVGAALFMALTRSLFRIFSGSFNVGKNKKNDSLTPNHVLNAVSLINEYIAQEHGEEGIFVTLFFGVLDPLTGMLEYINAGHEPVFVVEKTGIKESLKSTGPALGLIPGVNYKIETTQLNSNNILFGYTDGVTEAQSETNAFYTRKRLASLIESGVGSSAADFLDIIYTDLFEFIGHAPRSDDITMLAVKWHKAE